MSKTETSREETGVLQGGSIGGDQPLYYEGAGTGEQEVSAAGRRDKGVNINNLLQQTIGEVEVARGSCFA